MAVSSRTLRILTRCWKTLGVSRPRLPLIVLAVAALVAVVALVADGRPLAASGGKGGLPRSFWDYTSTSLVIVVVLVCLALVALVIAGAPTSQGWSPPPHTRALVSVVALSAIVCLLFLFFRLVHLHGGSALKQPNVGGAGGGRGGTPPSSGSWFRLDEVIVVVGLLLIAAVIASIVAMRRRAARRAGRLWAFGTGQAAVAMALDESLDDLRNDPDLRRAIIAAYARMEGALGASGVPRRPAEAPLEYLERALLALDTSQVAVRRLTDLFEWARFSHHEPEPSMRDEAIDALVAVRDELRAPAAVAA